MAVDSLDFLEYREQEVVMQFLGAVVDHPDIHVNRLQVKANRFGHVSVFLGQVGNVSAFNNRVELTNNISKPLLGRGWLKADSQGMDGWYEFTDDALEWFEQNRYSDGLVRSSVGRAAYQIQQRSPGPFGIDLDALSQQSGIPAERLNEQLYLLVGIGYLQEIGRSQTGPGLIRFNRDGLMWAAQGFPETLNQNNLNVEVTVNINIQAFIQQVRQLDIPAEDKYAAEDLVREIEREPSIENVSRMMGMAANAQALLPAVLDFFSRNGHAILQGFQNLGHL